MAKGRDMAAHLASVVDLELDGRDPSWVGQAFSPLGEDRHVQAARDRITAARAFGRPSRELGAVRRGSLYLLSQEALATELGRGAR